MGGGSGKEKNKAFSTCTQPYWYSIDLAAFNGVNIRRVLQMGKRQMKDTGLKSRRMRCWDGQCGR